jgi:zinc protease
VGIFEQDAVADAIESSFDGWQPGPEEFYPEAKPAQNTDFSLTDRSGAPQSTIMIGLPVVGPTHPDYVKLMLTNTLLGGSFGSRITSNIREDKGYTYSPYSTLNTRRGSSLWYEMADVTTEHTGASLAEISKEINRLKTEAPSEEELKGMQNYQAGVFVLQNSSPQGITNQLSFLDVYDLPEEYLTKMVERIHAVKPEDIKSMTDKYLNYDKMSLVVVGDKQQIEKQLDDFENRVEKN